MPHLGGTITLANGVRIPYIGFGTWQLPDGDTCVNAVRCALDTGYRHLDTAQGYGNEASVGRAVRESGIPRQDIFITSKLANSQRGYQTALQAFDESLNRLQTNYLDLFLIHWPASPSKTDQWDHINLETWQAFTELHRQGRIRAIGVSNFWPHHLQSLLNADVKPMVNQIEYHPGLIHTDVLACCRQHNIAVEGYCPLGNGKLLTQPLLQQLAGKYHRTVAQICLRWITQNGVIPLPKSATPARIAENADVFDFKLDTADMKAIAELPFSGGLNLHPDTI